VPEAVGAYPALSGKDGLLIRDPHEPSEPSEFERQFTLLNEQIRTSNSTNLQQAETIHSLQARLEESQARGKSVAQALRTVTDRCREVEADRTTAHERIRALEENTMQSMRDVEAFHARAKRNYLIASEFLGLLDDLGLADAYGGGEDGYQVPGEFLKLHILELRQQGKGGWVGLASFGVGDGGAAICL
jgi:hypothetical protein